MDRRQYLQMLAVGATAGSAGCAGALEDNTEKKKEILNRYADGVEMSNVGGKRMEEGTRRWNNEDYEEASNQYRQSKRKFGDSVDEFSAAVDLTYEVDNRDAREICKGAEEKVGLYESAADNFQIAAEAMTDGNRDRAERYLEYGREDKRQAERKSVPSGSALKEALDF